MSVQVVFSVNSHETLLPGPVSWTEGSQGCGGWRLWRRVPQVTGRQGQSWLGFCSVLYASLVQDLTWRSPSEHPGCVQSLALQRTWLLGENQSAAGFSSAVLKANSGHNRWGLLKENVDKSHFCGRTASDLETSSKGGSQEETGWEGANTSTFWKEEFFQIQKNAT